jgi:hypothetical protein
MEEKPKARGTRLSLYPLKFDEVISDVLKVKPKAKPKRKRKSSLSAKRLKG